MIKVVYYLGTSSPLVFKNIVPTPTVGAIASLGFGTGYDVSE